MPIYSKNRSGSMALESAKIDKNYGMNDIGIALYEACVNDHTIFNAMVNYDMNEFKALKEGTILESEIVALNEKSIGEIVDSLVETIKKVWAKIKKIFQDAMNKISAYILGDGIAFVKEFEKTKKKYNSNNAKLDKATIHNDKFVFNSPADGLIKQIEEYNYTNKEDIDKNALVNKELGKVFGIEELSPEGFKTHIKEHGFIEVKNVTANDNNTGKAIYVLTNHKETIESIKKDEKKVEEKLDNTIKALLKNRSKKELEAMNMAPSVMSTYVSAINTIMTTYTHGAIYYAKAKVSASRKMLGALMSKMRGFNESTTQSYAIDTMVELDMAFSEHAVVSDEVKNLVEAVYNEIA